MGFLDFLFGTVMAVNMMNTRRSDGFRSPASSDDDEARFDDGYSDDYVGDGLDGTDDYVGDGLDGANDDDDRDDGEY